MISIATANRQTRCRVLDYHGNRCGNEEFSMTGMCPKHLVRAYLDGRDLLKLITFPATGETSIDVLMLTMRPYNCLRRAGIETIGQLLEYSIRDLMDIRGFGVTSLDEVIEALTRHGLSLREETTENEHVPVPA